MYCPKCGTENPDNAQLCSSCSWVLTNTSTQRPASDAKTSGMAVTALVLGILSFFTFLLTAIPAIIFGIIGLVKIEKSGGQLKGRGLAIAGIAVPAVSLPFIAMLMAAILMPALARTRQLAQRVVCGTNMAGLGKAMIIYCNDFDGKYPPASQWCDLLIEHTAVCKEQFRCRGAKQGPCNYAMNAAIEKLGPAAPSDMVLLFETRPGWNQAGGPEILSTENHREGCNVVFNDSHVQCVKKKDIQKLRWTPEKNE